VSGGFIAQRFISSARLVDLKDWNASNRILP
jgi:hypothetical protein